MSKPGSARGKKQPPISAILSAKARSGKANEATPDSNRNKPRIALGVASSANKMAGDTPTGSEEAASSSSSLTLDMLSSELARQTAKLMSEMKKQRTEITAEVDSQTAKLMSEMKKQRTEIAAEVDALLKEALTPINTDLRGVIDQVASHATTIASMETALTDQARDLSKVESEVAALKTKVQDTCDANAKLQLTVEDLISRS